jgi:hypothetical protein
MDWDGFLLRLTRSRIFPRKIRKQAVMLRYYYIQYYALRNMTRVEASTGLVTCSTQATEGYSPLEPLQPDARQASQAYESMEHCSLPSIIL